VYDRDSQSLVNASDLAIKAGTMILGMLRRIRSPAARVGMINLFSPGARAFKIRRDSDYNQAKDAQTSHGQACAHTLDWSHRLFDDPTDHVAGS
jgi:hypothetical protein